MSENVTTGLIAAVAGLVTLFFSKRLDSSSRVEERRATERREDDRRRDETLANCQETIAELREQKTLLLIDRGALCATLAGKNIPLPPLLFHPPDTGES